jgi:hypothetical protein
MWLWFVIPGLHDAEPTKMLIDNKTNDWIVYTVFLLGITLAIAM